MVMADAQPRLRRGEGRLVFLRFSNRRLHILARIVRLFGAPFLHQRLELLIALRREHDADRGEEVAAAVLGRIALAFRRKVRPLLVPGGMVSSTGRSRVGTRTLAPSAAS